MVPRVRGQRVGGRWPGGTSIQLESEPVVEAWCSVRGLERTLPYSTLGSCRERRSHKALVTGEEELVTLRGDRCVIFPPSTYVESSRRAS